MKEILTHIFGAGKELEWYQMCVRALIAFIIALLLIRISGRRSFGMKTPFDTIISLLLGAVLSRGITGASPFFSACAACFVLVLCHRALAWSVIRSTGLARLVRGEPIELYNNGRFSKKNLSKSLVCEEEVLESVRLKANLPDFEKVDSVYLETDGELAVVKKPE